MATARRGRGPVVAAALLAVAVTVVALLWVKPLLERHGDKLSSQLCTVTLGTRSDTKTAEQANNAALIVAGSIQRGLPARAATIAIATAIQESSLRNIDYGDRDSIGLFQQRPSQGWGSVKEIMDPYYATDRFYAALVKVPDWQSLEVTVAAQAVQRSGFPDAYGDHEEEGRLWASALTGNGGRVTCELSAAQPTTAAALVERVAKDFGADAFTTTSLVPREEQATVSFADGLGLSTSERALAEWAVAVASVEGVTVSVADNLGWRREDANNVFVGTPTESASGGTSITVRTSAGPTPSP
jgi:hypothetical protein